MADNTIDAVDLLRSDHRGRIEVACVDNFARIWKMAPPAPKAKGPEIMCDSLAVRWHRVG